MTPLAIAFALFSGFIGFSFGVAARAGYQCEELERAYALLLEKDQELGLAHRMICDQNAELENKSVELEKATKDNKHLKVILYGTGSVLLN